MKFLPLLLLIFAPTSALANVPSSFTTGTMTQTVTATQTVNETIVTERYGGSINRWNGDNVEPIETGLSRTGDDAAGEDIIAALEFQVVDVSMPWQLEITTRPAGLVETINTERTVQTDTVTHTLSVFAQ